MKKIVSTIAMLMLSSTSFVAAEECPVVILPCSHNEKDELQFLLEQDEKNKDKLNSIGKDTVKGKVETQVKKTQFEETTEHKISNKDDIKKNCYEILKKIGFKTNDMVSISTEIEIKSKIVFSLIPVNPDALRNEENKYAWIKADEAVNKTKNSDDENLKNILGSTGWGKGKDKNFIELAKSYARLSYATMEFYLDTDKKNVFLKIEKNIFLLPQLRPFYTFAALKNAKVDDTLFASDIFTTEFYDGLFVRVIFKEESKLENKTEWIGVETIKFEKPVDKDYEITIEGKKYTIYKDIFNAIVTYLPKEKEPVDNLANPNIS